MPVMAAATSGNAVIGCQVGLRLWSTVILPPVLQGWR
jgi:hypothetical protein